MARLHDVTVLTRSASRPVIQQYLNSQPPGAPAPRFRFLEDSRLALLGKRWFPGRSWWRHELWQRDARGEIAKLHREFGFDLLHHVTWASFRSTPAVWGQGVPAVWGPISGVAATPWRLLPWRWPRELVHEAARNLSNRVALARLARAADFCKAILVSTREMQRAFAAAGVAARLVPELGVSRTPPPVGGARRERLRLVFSGRLVFVKGLHLALHALRAAEARAELHVFGDGPLRRALEGLSQRLGLGSRVYFHGWVAREQLLAGFGNFDVFLFPSLHDGVASALLEAMAAGLPVICLDCGGPGTVVDERCGRKVPVGSFHEIVRGLAQAIVFYERNPRLVSVHGFGAWERVRQDFDWDKLGAVMDSVYRQALQRR